MTVAVRLVAPLVCVLLLAAAAEETAYSETQAAMTNNAGTEIAAAEAEMGRLLAELQQRADGNREALGKLEKAQSAWMSYRDAQLEALWPFPDRLGYGSAHPMCISDTKRSLTEARIRELRGMLSRMEGDVCGSRWPE